MAKTINIRPTTGVYATYKHIRYEPWTAIAEFVDNSTQSFYDHESELQNLEIRIEYKNNELKITDNAFGMNFENFKRAIILDSKPKVITRSEFGMGLKTSACWFGINWNVETTEFGSDKKFSASIDVDALSRTKDEEISYEEGDCAKSEHGTVIRIWNLQRKLSGRQIKKTKDQLRGMYRRDLQSGKIKILYNGELLTYEMPKIHEELLPDGSKKIWKEDVSFKIKDDGKEYSVTGFIALLEKGNTSGAGFTLLRRGRVIVGGYEDCYRPNEVFGKPNSFEYQRLFGELNLDTFPVTQTKDSFDWYNNGLEDALIAELEKASKKYVEHAQKFRKRNNGNPLNLDVKSTVQEFSNAGIIQNLEIKESLENSEDIQRNNEQISQLKFEVKQEGQVLPKIETIQIIGNENSKISFTIDGRKYLLNYSMKKNLPESKWLSVSPQRKNSLEKEFDIEWNIAHPFFKPYFENQEIFDAMKKFVFALVLSEVETTYTSSNNQKIDPWDIREKMNETLKTVMRSE